MSKNAASYIFPKGFLWGTATSAHQVEGNNPTSDWWHWEHAMKSRVKSGNATTHYKTFASDFLLAKALHNNAHRISLEWARLEPAMGSFDKKEILHYRSVLQKLKRLGFTTFVTLNHFTYPHWYAKLGAFEQKKNIRHFERYVALCAKQFADLVDFWITVNEPISYTINAYVTGVWPPGEKNIFRALTVFRNFADAHNSAYRTIHRYIPNASVGAAYNLIQFSPKTTGLLDRLLCRAMRYIEQDMFYVRTRHMHDFLGINYYTQHSVSVGEFKKRFIEADMYGILQDKQRNIGWSMNPKGLSSLLTNLRQFNIPIYITEHGIADATDIKRRKLLIQTIREIHKAIEGGADVRGYFHWSLMDNFEWSLGFAPKFGLFKVNYRTMERTPRKSAALYAKICKDNGLIA